MTLDIKDIRFERDLPKLPDIGPVVSVATPDYDQRAKGMTALVEALRLGRPRDACSEFGRALITPRGEVEFFHASGAVWATDIAAAQEHDSELRDWPDLTEGKTSDGPHLTLGRKAAAAALDLARDMAERGGFDLKHAADPVLSLIQVAELDEKGQELRSGAGEATMAFGYALEGLPVIGAGAKTLIDMVPVDGAGLQATGAVNVWRQPKASKTVHLGGTEAVLAAGLLQDPDLLLAAKKGGQIVIEDLRLGLMALPAMMVQDMLLPMVEVSGRVELRDEKAPHYNFGRFCPAVTQKACDKAGIACAYHG
ncbi:MAG: hypothetical protein ACK5IB_07640 [Qingshengfaniella sp.]